jgi:hypothetical protein
MDSAVSGDLNRHYRHLLSRDDPGAAPVTSAAKIPADAVRANLRRENKTHQGVGSKLSLRILVAAAVNQDFLEEISHLERLEYLEMDWPTTAENLTPLTSIPGLKVLKINSPRAITDFTPLLQLPALKVLFIENAKFMTSLDWLEPLAGRLTVLGVEGSMWTRQRIPSLAPLSGFLAEALFLSSTSIGDRSLKPLQSMPNLRFLGTARNAPRSEFVALQAARPSLVCDWFSESLWPGSK